jgi:hypothetical protein
MSYVSQKLHKYQVKYNSTTDANKKALYVQKLKYYGGQSGGDVAGLIDDKFDQLNKDLNALESTGLPENVLQTLKNIKITASEVHEDVNKIQAGYEKLANSAYTGFRKVVLPSGPDETKQKEVIDIINNLSDATKTPQELKFKGKSGEQVIANSLLTSLEEAKQDPIKWKSLEKEFNTLLNGANANDATFKSLIKETVYNPIFNSNIDFGAASETANKIKGMLDLIPNSTTGQDEAIALPAVPTPDTQNQPSSNIMESNGTSLATPRDTKNEAEPQPGQVTTPVLEIKNPNLANNPPLNGGFNRSRLSLNSIML